MTWAKGISKPARLTLIMGVLLLVMVAPTFHHTPPAAAQEGSTHTVQSGENLFRIALRYNTTVEVLAALNGITDPTRIYAGQVLVLPGATATPAPAAVAQADPITVAAPVSTTNTAPVYHTVQRGETLASIGRAYGVTWADIAAANGLANPNQIFGGQQLLIPGASAPGTAAVAPPVTTTTTVSAPVTTTTTTVAATGTTRTHVVQKGEHLAAIARTYGVSWPTIARANNIADPNTIYAGQTLTIPATDDGQGTYLQPTTWTPSAPAPTITTGKQIIVDLSDQRTYAYENGQLLRSTLVSTGLSYYPTVQGDYRVYLKYQSQAMSGPGYYLPGVPYVMYFYQGYSLHGTYWHSNFGQPMSHGCVNMPTSEAQWFYNWAPIGTPVHVQW